MIQRAGQYEEIRLTDTILLATARLDYANTVIFEVDMQPDPSSYFVITNTDILLIE